MPKFCALKVRFMRAVKAQFDGEKVIVPDEMRGTAPGDVILVFEDAPENGGWQQAQESALKKVWDNSEDSVYDAL